MTHDNSPDEKVKKERSPSYPFISLERAVERAAQMAQNHKRSPARLVTVAPSWGYGIKSSGLLQTVAALKQYGLIDDSGSGEDRRIQLTDLAWRILTDSRPGAKEQALKDAGTKPRLFSEYLAAWLPDPPSNDHRVSELTLDRGFTKEAALAFIKAFDETVAFANLGLLDTLSPSLEMPGKEQMDRTTPDRPPSRATQQETALALMPVAIGKRFKVEMTENAIGVTAMLVSAAEVEKLIKILEANKSMLPETAPTAEAKPEGN